MSISTIIGLSLILVILIMIFIGVIYLRRKARKFSRELFGTDDLGEISSSLQQEASNTPKSVSGMTRLLLPAISKDFPEFDYDEMKHNAENTLISYLRAISSQKTRIPNVATELNEQLQHQIEMNDSQQLHEHYENIHIHRTEISEYKKEAGRCLITFQSSVGCLHYKTDQAQNIKTGSRELTYQTRFNTYLEYIQDQKIIESTADTGLGLHCPNCDAPIPALGAKVCEYCGSPVTEFNLRVWQFCHIEERG